MKIIVQRTTHASVSVDGSVVVEIGQGFVCFVAFRKGEKEDGFAWGLRKLLSTAFWDGDDGSPWRKSISDVGGSIVFIYDAGIYADVDSADVPKFDELLEEEEAKKWYDKLVGKVKEQYKPEKVFAQPIGQKLKVDFINDGPLTITIDSFNRK